MRAASAIVVAASWSVAATAARPPPRPVDPVQQASVFENADDAFLAARDAYRNNDPARAAAFSQRVTALDGHYPLAAYLDYWALQRRVVDYGNAQSDDAPEDAVRAFIAREPASVVADLARRDWLIALGKRGEWTAFEAQLPTFALDDDPQVTCFHLTARALRLIRGGGDVAATSSPTAATSPASTATPGTIDADGAKAIDELLRQSRAAIGQPRDFASDTGACATLARVLVAEKRIAPQDDLGLDARRVGREQPRRGPSLRAAAERDGARRRRDALRQAARRRARQAGPVARAARRHRRRAGNASSP